MRMRGRSRRERHGVNMEKKFKRGNVVKLKSGGPDMTVVEYGNWDHSDEEKVSCRWFEGKGKPHEEQFFEDELQLAESGIR